MILLMVWVVIPQNDQVYVCDPPSLSLPHPTAWDCSGFTVWHMKTTKYCPHFPSSLLAWVVEELCYFILRIFLCVIVLVQKMVLYVGAHHFCVAVFAFFECLCVEFLHGADVTERCFVHSFHAARHSMLFLFYLTGFLCFILFVFY